MMRLSERNVEASAQVLHVHVGSGVSSFSNYVRIGSGVSSSSKEAGSSSASIRGSSPESESCDSSDESYKWSIDLSSELFTPRHAFSGLSSETPTPSITPVMTYRTSITPTMALGSFVETPTPSITPMMAHRSLA